MWEFNGAMSPEERLRANLRLISGLTSGCFDSVKEALAQGADPNVTLSSGARALAKAFDVRVADRAENGNRAARIATLLLEAGANPLDPPGGGLLESSPLNNSISAGGGREMQALRLRLLAMGVSPNTRGFEGDTPLHVAAQVGGRIFNEDREDLCEAFAALLKAGADLDLKNLRGETVWDILRSPPRPSNDLLEICESWREARELSEVCGSEPEAERARRASI